MALRYILCLSSLGLLAIAQPASAQNDQSPLVPGLDRFELNGTRTTPRPAATPRPAPRATPTPAPRAVPVVRPTPTARPAETVLDPDREDAAPVRAAPVIAPPAAVTPDAANPPAAGAPASSAAPSALIDIGPDQPLARPTATPLSADAAAADGSDSNFGIWALLIGLVVLVAAGIAGYIFWMRRRQMVQENLEIEMTDTGAAGATAAGADPLFDAAQIPPRADPTPPSARAVDLPDLPSGDAFPPAPPQPAAATPSPTPFFIKDTVPTNGPRARLELTVRPQRAGTNLTSAAVDYEIDIANTGDADAIGIRMDLRLLSASADQDAILTALYAAPIDKPIVAPFDIPAGEQVSLGGMALLPNEALSIMTVQGRDFFVPLLSLNLIYGWGGAARGQTASAHVIGIERPDDVKMAPFRLDTGARMYDHVGARMHTLTVTR